MKKLQITLLVLIILFMGGVLLSLKEKPVEYGTVSQVKNSIYPNSQLTPGVINPDVTQANIQSTICVSGWTKTIRPMSSYTTMLKKYQLGITAVFSYPSYLDLPRDIQMPGGYLSEDKKTADYEEDHLVSLELGGHSTDPKNLWPESYTTTPNARDKDMTENYLHKEVCAGRMTLAEAQKEISTDWVAVYKQMKPTFGGVDVSNSDD